MAKKKVEDYSFLVEGVMEISSKKYGYNMLNMLGYLVFRHSYYTEYRRTHNDFFYVSADEFGKAIGISRNTVAAYACRFVKDGLINYCSGKLHHPSQYRLLWDVGFLELHHPEASCCSNTSDYENIQEADIECADGDLCISIKNKEKRIENIEKSMENDSNNWFVDGDPTMERMKKLVEDIKNGVVGSETELLARCKVDELQGVEDVFLRGLKKCTPSEQ